MILEQRIYESKVDGGGRHDRVASSIMNKPQKLTVKEVGRRGDCNLIYTCMGPSKACKKNRKNRKEKEKISCFSHNFVLLDEEKMIKVWVYLSN